MVDGADANTWSQVASGWSDLWGTVAEPAGRSIIEAAEIGPGKRVLDVGCGSGEFLRLLSTSGARAIGADPAPLMVEVARARGGEVVEAAIEKLPFPDGSFDVATAVNALQFAGDTTAALREMARVLRSGGFVAIANRAEGSLNDVDVIEAALAEMRGQEHLPDGPLRPAGGIEAAFRAAGLDAVVSGLAATPWHAGDEAMLVSGILLGEDEHTVSRLRAAVVAAAGPFLDPTGGFVFRNSFRWSIARS